MARKHSESCGSCDGEDFDEVTIEEQVVQKIKELPSLADKVQAIAINSYLIEKRALDKKLEGQVNVIEVNHRKTYEPLLKEIFDIVNGNTQLTDADLEGVDHLLTEQQKQVKKNYYVQKPIQQYWFKAFISSDALAENIHPDDQNPLHHLINVTATKDENGNNLTVTFFFSQNEWFTNTSIKKQFQIEGDQIKRSYGDVIQWKEGKNLTQQIVKKKNKKKKTTTTKVVEKQSFFNLFKEIDLTEQQENKQKDEEDQQDAELQGDVEKVELQYQMCNAIYQQVLPRSLEFFLGVVGGMDLQSLMQLQGALGGAVDGQDQEEQVDA